MTKKKSLKKWRIFEKIIGGYELVAHNQPLTRNWAFFYWRKQFQWIKSKESDMIWQKKLSLKKLKDFRQNYRQLRVIGPYRVTEHFLSKRKKFKGLNQMKWLNKLSFKNWRVYHENIESNELVAHSPKFVTEHFLSKTNNFNRLN